MNFLKIKTADGIHREIDLIDYAVYQRNADKVFDSIIETDDGTQTIYQRARRRTFGISLDGIPQSYVDTLEQIWKDRQECYFEGNVGENTRVYHPFETGKNPLLGGIGLYGRASVATYTGLDGKIREVGSGLPRFEACKMGNGIILEMARTNYFYPSHGASGSTIWTTQQGAPVVAWDTNIASNVYGKVGTIRLELTSATPDIVKTTVAGLTPAATYSCFIWAKGAGSILLNVYGATGTVTSGTKTLTMDWQQIAVEGFIATASSVEMWIIGSTNTRLWVSAHQVEAGHTFTSYIPTVSAAVPRLMDQWSIVTTTNYAEGSIAFWLKFPRVTSGADGTRYPWYLNANFYSYISADGKIGFAIASGVGIEIAYATHGLTPGTIAHLAFVWKRDYCAIIINGVAVGTSTSNVRVSGAASTLQLYAGSGCPNTVIDDLRLDDRYVEWRTSETGLYMRYSSTSNLAFCKVTQGRKFRIKGADFKPREGDPAYFNGTFVMEESSSDENFTIGAK